LLGRFLVLDALEMRFRELKLRRNPDCQACGEAARKAGSKQR
jgi:adenylyltransferase/sulfurtransferase